MAKILDISRKEEHFFPFHDHSRVPLCVLRVASEEWGPRFRIARENVQRYVLLYVAAGRGTLRGAAGDSALEPGSVTIIGKGPGHDLWCHPADPLRVFVVAYSGLEAPRLTLAAVGAVNAVVNLAFPADMQGLLALMVSEARHKTPSSHDVCELMLRTVLLKVGAARLVERQTPSPSLATYLRCRRHIDEYFCRLSNVREIARECRVDPAYLCRLFSRHAREAPYKYLTRLKMSRATHLLANSELSVKEIARELEFCDPYTFSRAFRRTMRQSPQQYRTTPRKAR